jgi:hypothetical protein
MVLNDLIILSSVRLGLVRTFVRVHASATIAGGTARIPAAHLRTGAFDSRTEGKVGGDGFRAVPMSRVLPGQESRFGRVRPVLMMVA